MSSPIDKSLLWNVGVKPEVMQLLDEVNPKWRDAHYITTEFYLDPIDANPEKYKFLYASPKSRQKWFINHYLISIGWYPRTPSNKVSVCVNPHPKEKPAKIPNMRLQKVKSHA